MKAGNLHPKGQVCYGMELAIRFAEWARSCHGTPSIEQIQAQFNVHRSTAYRWRHAWFAARGECPPKRKRS
ncbi:helix-turn-helix domain-containing protein [Luteibacter anthropi]|uniref:helix-turn-helix domain-containing protein n=1 Tax=Luteibacter anthropi TaxID=564369 RepID=UPI002032B922|nr:helix-turn-helix domain-containing protein [Luteibacter anthropi]URX63284.1 helix-turn-helix domain-containing protein [Luteibacter anthropi]